MWWSFVLPIVSPFALQHPLQMLGFDLLQGDRGVAEEVMVQAGKGTV